jgi:hypothetical protein
MNIQENTEYFELKYLEEINDLFNQMKNIDNYYNSNLINNENNFLDLMYFIIDNIEINDIYNLSEEDNDDIIIE